MPITDLQAIQRILKPLSQAELTRAAEDNDRQRFHAVTATSKDDAGPYADKFLNRIRLILNNDEKFERFKQLMAWPLPTSRLIDQAADEYLKAFDAEDKYINLEFTDDNLQAVASDYLAQIEFDDFLNKDLFNQCLRAAGSIWIVDLPATPNADGFPEPRPSLREFGELTDIGVTKAGEILYVIFPLDSIKNEENQEVEKRWAVLDDASFRVVSQRNGEPHRVLLSNPHELGRTPAGFIWHDRLDRRKPLRIQSPLHALLADLDRFVTASVFREHADLYASFPILWSYKTRCTYETAAGDACNSGYVTLRGETGEETLEACPVCRTKKPIGPGSHLQPPAPQDNTSADLSSPAGFINAERDLLDYNAEKLDALEADLILALTGDDGTIDQSTNAVNLDQVHARFVKRKAILSYWAEHTERTHEEILRVLFGLFAGDRFIDVSVDYGSEFHMLSPGQAIADYDSARKAGLPTYQLMARRSRIDKLLAGSSESEALRYYMLAQLEPYPDLALAQVPSGSDAWELKANFSQYISRFERENKGLEIFNKNASMAARISSITQILYTYVSQDKAKREVPQVEGVGPGFGK